MVDHHRPSELRTALRVSTASVVWAVVVGIAAGIAGVVAHSLALIGFGLDAVVDGSASAVLVWRFAVEHRDPTRGERAEDVAHRAIALTLLAIAGYLVVGAVHSLAVDAAPKSSAMGVGLAVAAVLVLPGLAAWKIRVARRLDSPALHSDGVLTATGALLGLFALLSAGLRDAFGWRWTDAAAALLISVVLVREGIGALRVRP